MRLIGEALFAVIAQCNLSTAPPELIYGIIKQESLGYIYALSGSYENANYSKLPKSKEEALHVILVTKESRKRNINISAGLMQVNSVHMKQLSPEQSGAYYHPCTNVKFGTAIVAEIMGRVCAKAITDECIDTMLRQYNTGSTRRSNAGLDYTRKVRDKWSKVVRGVY